jgi:serine phosphatase RsbU (regulator of sigma subunit)
MKFTVVMKTLKKMYSPPHSSIKQELFKSSALLALIVVVVFGFFLSAILYYSGISKANSVIKQTNQSVVFFIEGYFTEIINTITVLNENREIRDAMTLNKDAHRRILEGFHNITRANKNITYIYSAYKNGLMLINDWTPPAGFDPTIRPWYQAAMATRPETSFGIPYQEIVSKEWLISTGRALSKSDGKVSGVVAVDCSIDKIAKLIAKHDEYKTAYSFVMDQTGKIIMHPDQSLLGKLLQEITDALLRDSKGDFVYHLGNVEYFAHYRRIVSTGWIVVTVVEKREILRPIVFQVLFIICVTGVIAVLLGLVQSILLSRRLSRPLVELGRRIKAIIAGDDLNEDEYVYPKNEIGIMAREIGQLAEKELNAKTLELQKTNDNIMESIGYARRLQNAILPNLQQRLGLDSDRCFSIWRPRDTVGGDMFWCRTDGDKKLLVVADCTGHGVPGALMTMTLSSILDAVARETGFSSPSKILDLTNQRLKQNLMQNNDDTLILDGADIAMLMIDTEMKQLVFAGAGLSMFTVIDGKVEECKGSKTGIGYTFGKESEYEDIKIQYTKDSKYYFTTDGFTDQNKEPGKGGIGKKGFIAILKKISSTGMKEQMLTLEREIESKLQNVPQRDDITIIGLEL